MQAETSEWVSSKEMAIALNLNQQYFYQKMDGIKDRVLEGYHVKRIHKTKHVWHKERTIFLVESLKPRPGIDINKRSFNPRVKERQSESVISCPNCQSKKISVLDSRLQDQLRFRRRSCVDCSLRFVTVESVLNFKPRKPVSSQLQNINSELLDRLKCDSTRREAIEQVQEKLHLKNWNETLAYLDFHYPGWRGYAVNYVDGTKG